MVARLSVPTSPFAPSLSDGDCLPMSASPEPTREDLLELLQTWFDRHHVGAQPHTNHLERSIQEMRHTTAPRTENLTDPPVRFHAPMLEFAQHVVRQWEHLTADMKQTVMECLRGYEQTMRPGGDVWSCAE